MFEKLYRNVNCKNKVLLLTFANVGVSATVGTNRCSLELG